MRVFSGKFLLLATIGLVGRSQTVTSLAMQTSPSAPEIQPRQFIRLNNPIGGMEQSIPASFVEGWPTWTLDTDGTLTKIPDDDGFVSPSSIDELWHPIDLKRPDLRLALGLHVREGVIRHVMPSVDLSFHDGQHRNRGMCTVPRAHSWIDFTNSLDEWETYKIILAEKKKDADSWTELSTLPSGGIINAIERGMVCLADAPDELGDGSHIVNILIDKDIQPDTLECPKSGAEMRVVMDDDNFMDSPDAPPGALQVMISSTMAGSESEYLPEAYKELFSDEKLKNPLYSKFVKRKEERKK